MPLSDEIKHIQDLLEKQSLTAKERAIEDDLKTILDVLQCPVFGRVLSIQESVEELKEQVQKHPSILPNDFDISPATGQLVLNVPPETNQLIIGKDSDAYEPSSDLEHTFEFECRTQTSIQNDLISSSKDSVIQEPDYVNISSKLSKLSYPSYSLSTIATDNYAEEFRKTVAKSAAGRKTITIQLYKADGSSLGFSVVGLKNEQKDELGIYIQDIHPNGIAARDGRLQKGDQILAIDGQPLDSDISHEAAINILQRAHGIVELVIARGSISEEHQLFTNADSILVENTADNLKDSSEMVLNTEWAQIESIQIENDGSGLGFGIIGGRSTGVVVKTILPGGVADRDGRMQNGDHILQINDVNLRGMGSDQVAQVLRQAGTNVRLIVARPVDPSDDFSNLQCNAPIVPTRSLLDPEEIEKCLVLHQQQQQLESTEKDVTTNKVSNVIPYSNVCQPEGIKIFPQQTAQVDFHASLVPQVKTQSSFEVAQPNKLVYAPVIEPQKVQVEPAFPIVTSKVDDQSPEMETFEVELVKDQQGLGITIAGYVCEKEEISGIFIKSIAPGSVADVSKKICINDQIIEVDGRSLYGYTNHQAVEVLRNTGKVVKLRLARYLRGSKYDQLQQAISSPDLPLPPPNYQFQQTAIPGATVIQVYDQTIESSANKTENPLLNKESVESKNKSRINQANDEANIITKWNNIMGPDYDIIIANIKKLRGGLGISLEGTVDVENGNEVHPHHYIRSILSDGSVGLNGKLKTGDELLEVNGNQLHGLSHEDVVPLLKDLPLFVQLVCARKKCSENANHDFRVKVGAISSSISSVKTDSGLPTHGSISSLTPSVDRLVKAKSDGSLAISSNAVSVNDYSKFKSRSLEPITGLAMWSSEAQIIELIKGDRGLGFSILDYQDPMNPNETVIVIRSLVPGGVAQQDGRLIPGDRLLFVNETILENASLDVAVQALKGAPKGKVLVGVAKPLPLPESNNHPSIISQSVSFDDLKSPLKTSIKPSENNTKSLPNCSIGLIEKNEKDKSYENGVERQESVTSSIDLKPCSKSESLSSVPIEPFSISASPSLSGSSNIVLSDSYSSTPFDISPSMSPTPFSHHKQPSIVLPTALERTIKIKKGNDSLGLTLEMADGGANGMIIKSLSKKGAIYSDQRISQGDFLIAVNNESLRNVTNSQARAILRRTQLLTNDIILKYIPFDDAEVHKQTISLTMQHGQTPPSDRESPSLLPLLKRTPSPSSPYFPSNFNNDKQDLSGERGSISSSSSASSIPPSPPRIPPPETFIYENLQNFSTSNNEANQNKFVSPNLASTSKANEFLKENKKDLTQHDSSESLDSTSINQSDESKEKKDVPPILMEHFDNENSENSENSEKHLSSESSSEGNTASCSSTITRQYGEERIVELWRDPNKGLGISIVGGKVDLFYAAGGNTITGIFIKNVLPDSPAGKEGTLKNGDRLLEVDNIDLREATHDKAVKAIKNAKNPVKFVVQSLLPLSKDRDNSSNQIDTSSSATLAPLNSGGDSEDLKEQTSESSSIYHSALNEQLETSEKMDFDNSLSSECTKTNEKSFEQANDGAKVSSVNETEKNISLSYTRDDEPEFKNGETNLMGKAYTKKGVEIDRASAGNIKLNNDEEEDIFGYNSKKIQKKYGDLNGKTFVVDLNKGPNGLGISLAGNKDRTKMSVFVCGMHPNGSAFKDGRIQIGDEILEVNGIIIQGRSHLNASAIIKSISGNIYKIILLRREGALDEMAVKPITQFPVHLKDDLLEERYSKFKGVRLITVRKSTHGLGIMIIEGRHNELGRGVFVSDIQEGSPAEQAGLNVGDMILCVNQNDLVGADYDTAASTLKGADGLLTLVIAKPSKSVQDTISEESKSSKENLQPTKVIKDKNVPPPTPPKPINYMHKTSMHVPIWTTSTAANGSLSRNAQRTVPSTSSTAFTIQNYKARSVASNLDNQRNQSSAHQHFLPHVKETSEPLYDFKTCEVKCGQESIIEIVKEKLGLGLSIVGGVDTPLNGVIIHEVYPDGAAALDGRLKPGDQILEVNGEDLRNAPHEQAIAALRQTPSLVQMRVFREDRQTIEEDVYDLIEVELTKKTGKGLGLSIVGRKNGCGVFVSEVVKGGIADCDGRIVQGDQILEVNGQDLKNSTQEYAAAILKTINGKIFMKIGRHKAGSRHNASENLALSKSDEMSTDEPLICKEIILEKGSEGLGFSIVGGFGSIHGDLPIYIKEIFENSAAHKDGKLQKGDQLVSVNDQSLEGLTHDEAVEILKNVNGTVKLVVLGN